MADEILSKVNLSLNSIMNNNNISGNAIVDTNNVTPNNNTVPKQQEQSQR